MTTDPVFYRLFETLPETFFLVLGMSADLAKETAARYQYQALELKETSHRIDGVFRPKDPGLPVCFLEVQFYQLPSVYAGVLAKTFTFLKHHDASQPYRAVVLFSSRALEPEDVSNYQPLLDAGLLQRFYLDEMPEMANAPLGLSILNLITQAEAQAAATARDLVARVKSEIEDAALRHDLVEFIETVILYKLPRLTREEIQAMLQVHDIRETRVFQEALEEGRQEGIEKGRQEGIEKGIKKERQRSRQEKLRLIPKMAARKLSATVIAEILGIEVELVRKTMAKKEK